MSTTERAGPRRLALVSIRYGASGATPPGIDPVAFVDACLADGYEVLADLEGVTAGIAGPPGAAELLWPGGVLLPDLSVLQLAARVAPEVDELVVVAADAPDLPGLVLAKMFKVLHRVDVTLAPDRSGPGCVAVGVRLPLAAWLPELDLDQPVDQVEAAAPAPGRCVRSPDWHRLRGPADLARLDPGLEGWAETRALLSGRSLSAG